MHIAPTSLKCLGTYNQRYFPYCTNIIPIRTKESVLVTHSNSNLGDYKIYTLPVDTYSILGRPSSFSTPAKKLLQKCIRNDTPFCGAEKKFVRDDKIFYAANKVNKVKEKLIIFYSTINGTWFE